MTPADETTPVAYAAYAAEGALCLAGVAVALWLWRGAGARPWRERRLAEWRIPALDAACYVCCGLVGALVLGGAAGAALRHARIGSDAATLVGSALMEGGFLLGMGAFHLFYAGRRPSGPAGGVALAVRSGVATFLVALPLVFLSSFGWEHLLVRLGLPDEKQELVGILENTHSAALRCAFVAVAALLVPLAEECLFRGIVFRYLRTRIPGAAALALSCALFGAPHVEWANHMVGLPSLVPLIVLAAVFCVAYERTGNLGTTVVAHALFNLNMMALVIAGIGS